LNLPPGSTDPERFATVSIGIDDVTVLGLVGGAPPCLLGLAIFLLAACKTLGIPTSKPSGIVRRHQLHSVRKGSWASIICRATPLLQVQGRGGLHNLVAVALSAVALLQRTQCVD
jgi:hypothetical protein